VGNSHDGTSHFPDRFKPTGVEVENTNSFRSIGIIGKGFHSNSFEIHFSISQELQSKIYKTPSSGHKERTDLILKKPISGETVPLSKSIVASAAASHHLQSHWT
jgi:hypothetical protein